MTARVKKSKAKSARRAKASVLRKKRTGKVKAKGKLSQKDRRPKALKVSAQLPVQAERKPGEERIDRLFVAINGVRAGIRSSVRTTKLLSGGTSKMAQKVIEEAAAVGIEAIRGDRTALVYESADLIYNLLALWAEVGVSPADVWQEMDGREALLGMAEKLPKLEG